MQTRREFLGGTLAAGALAASAWGEAAPRRKPNVVVILTDDQGYADLGCHGNPHLKTPNLDRLHAESTRFSRFYTYPVCSPTRASLMTGRYAYRTGVVDTYVGRSNMDPREVTLAQALRNAGYATGIFGKWHLGDTYPLRPADRGFDEALIHKGGGLCQPSDPRVTSYTDPILWRNGEETRSKGYCTDIFTDAAIAFARAHREHPFFAYLSLNAPHTPLDARAEDAAPYLAAGVPPEDAKLYGIITNLDANVGRLLGEIDALGLREDTLVVFFTDNGIVFTKDGERFDAGLRGTKGTPYEGGIRVPCFLRWPGGGTGAREVTAPASVIDLMPTLLDACGAAVPAGVALDGASLLPALRGRDATGDRTLFSQWHRGDVPVAHRSAAVITARYKLVNGAELYDLEKDPGETRDIVAENPGVAAELRARYEAWFTAVCAGRDFGPQPIIVGSAAEPVTWLTAQDMRGVDGWGPKDIGVWHIAAESAGAFVVEAHWLPGRAPKGGKCVLDLDGREHATTLADGADTALFAPVPLGVTAVPVRAWIETGEGRRRPEWLIVRRA